MPPIAAKSKIRQISLPSNLHLASAPSEKPSEDVWSIMGAVRIVLAMIVVCTHIADGFCVNPHFTQSVALAGGSAAVMAFFVISGISMSHSIVGNGDAKAFFMRRIDRIYPLYFCGVLLGAIVYAIYGNFMTIPRGATYEAPANIWQFLSAFVFLQNQFHDGNKGFWANPSLWSLCVEVGLYMTVPLLGRLSLKWLMALTGLFWLINVYHTQIGIDWALWYDLPFLCSWAFLTGFTYFRVKETRWANAFLLSSVLMIYAYNHDNDGAQAVPLFMAVCYLITLAVIPGHIDKRVGTFMRYLGDLSLAVYVCHYPVLWIATLHFGIANEYKMLAVCILSAMALLHLVDLPLRAYRKNRRSANEVSVQHLQIHNREPAAVVIGAETTEPLVTQQ